MRPTAEPNIKRLSPERLQAIAKRLGPTCEVIADFSKILIYPTPSTESEDTSSPHDMIGSQDSSLLSMLKRRPCSLNDICVGLDMKHNEALKHISRLQEHGLIHAATKDGHVFYRSVT